MFGKVNLSLKNFEVATDYLDKCLTLALKYKHDDCIVYSLGALSQLALSKNNVDEGIRLAEDALEYLKKNVKTNHRELWNEAHIQLSQAYIKKQEYSRSLEMSQELLRSCKEMGDVEKENNCSKKHCRRLRGEIQL